MPRHVIPIKSGVHRVACFALYRALLWQASQTPLDEPQKKSLQHVIRSKFYRSAKIQSPRQIVAALELGYKSLQTLKEATSVQSPALQHLSAFLKNFHIPAIHTSRSALSPSRDKAKATKPKQHAGVPVVWPRSEVLSVLSRPFPFVTGKRHIPKLVNSTGLPFLRLTKPQSPFLSRIIGDKHKLRQKRYDRIDVLQEQLDFAETEDEWDKLLVRMHGIQESNSNGGKLWATVPHNALRDVRQQLKADYEKTNKVTVQMFEVVEKEKALAKEEELERRRHKGVRMKALRSQNR